MSAPEKLLGAGALVMALCCALLPLAGAAFGGGLIARGGIEALAGLILLAGVVILVVHRRRVSRRC